MTTANLDQFDLSEVDLGGEINEDVLQQIIRVDEWDNPLLAMAGSRSTGNAFYEWTNRDYAAPVLDNQRVDGADAGVDESRTGIRVGNHTQTLDKVLRVSEMAQEADTIGRASELSLQLQERGTELLRDKEAQFASNNGSLINTSAVAGVSAGIVAWLSNEKISSTDATGVIASVGGVASIEGSWKDQVATEVPGRDYTSATTGALTETVLKDVSQAIYEQGGNATVLMANPTLTRKMGEYFFSSGARIATLESKVSQGNRGGAVAQGRVNVWISDFAVFTITPNRNILETDTANDTVYVLDPSQLRITNYAGMKVNNLAKTGAADNRQIIWKGGFQIDAWPKCGLVVDVDKTEAMVA